jgi:hypothetical protein
MARAPRAVSAARRSPARRRPRAGAASVRSFPPGAGTSRWCRWRAPGAASGRARVAGPGGAGWRRSERAGARATLCVGPRAFARAGGALAAPAPQALLSRFLGGEGLGSAGAVRRRGDEPRRQDGGGHRRRQRRRPGDRHALAAEGATVWIAGRREGPLAEAAEAHPGLRPAVADVTDEGSVRALFAATGPADIVVANAGAARARRCAAPASPTGTRCSRSTSPAPSSPSARRSGDAEGRPADRHRLDHGAARRRLRRPLRRGQARRARPGARARQGGRRRTRSPSTRSARATSTRR